MKQNIDKTQRLIRFGAGAFLVGVAMGRNRLIKKPLNMLGMMEFSSALTGYCPLFDIIGINQLTPSAKD